MEKGKECRLTARIKNMSCELKLAYVLIIILFVLCAVCCKRCRMDKLIAKWIDNNPKAIIESVQKFVEREQANSQAQQTEAATSFIKDNMNKLADETNTGVINPKGTKVIVEFYDYNCGYCKMAAKAVKELTDSDKDIKVVFREYPILSEVSVTAAEYSIAVAMTEPKKFADFHHNLFDGDARTLEGIKNAVTKSGISIDKVEKTLKSKKAEIDKRLSDNREIATAMRLGGTPAFVINGQLIPGYVDAEQMRSIL
jgi:protein-disulfide isomerase